MEENYDIFIGSNRDYEKVVKKNNMHIDPDDPGVVSPEQKEKKEVKIDDLSRANLKKLDDETLKILRRTRTVADYETIFMQHKLDFYDEYYNSTDIPDELQAVKRLRRIYRNYRDFLNAMSVRDRYISYLVEKYGGESEFLRKSNMGVVQDWIPSTPKLSKKCPDYDLYLAGVEPMDEYEPTEEEITQIRQYLEQAASGLDVRLQYGVETNIGDIKVYEKFLDNLERKYVGKPRSITSVVSTGDLQSLQNVFKSWYKPETKSAFTKELFYNAPENIKKRFLAEKEINEPGLLSEYVNGLHDEPDKRDPNEMVFDAELGRSIPYKEWAIREDIRLFAKAGWSKAKLMNYRNIGSKLEQIARKGKPNRKRRRRQPKQQQEAFPDILQTYEDDGLESSYADNEYILGQIEQLMRG